jgi:hypothetical protein
MVPIKIISDNPKPNNPNNKSWIAARLGRSTAEIAIIKMVTTLSKIKKYRCSKGREKREYFPPKNGIRKLAKFKKNGARGVIVKLITHLNNAAMFKSFALAKGAEYRIKNQLLMCHALAGKSRGRLRVEKCLPDSNSQTPFAQPRAMAWVVN